VRSVQRENTKKETMEIMKAKIKERFSVSSPIKGPFNENNEK
jgi:hypothetical protein